MIVVTTIVVNIIVIIVIFTVPITTTIIIVIIINLIIITGYLAELPRAHIAMLTFSHCPDPPPPSRPCTDRKSSSHSIRKKECDKNVEDQLNVSNIRENNRF